MIEKLILPFSCKSLAKLTKIFNSFFSFLFSKVEALSVTVKKDNVGEVHTSLCKLLVAAGSYVS
jgi:hypothetical protein